MSARMPHQYLAGYRSGARTGPGYDHVTLDAVDRMFERGQPRWCIEQRDNGAYWRGYSAGFAAKIVGVDLSVAETPP